MKIGSRVKIISASCYHGRCGVIIARNIAPGRWMVLIDGDEVSFNAAEMEMTD